MIGLGSVLGLAGGALGFLGQERTNQANAKMAHEQMEFQERMSSTAHQREIKDLAAAGLNPILSGTGGHGASSPGGAMATMGDSIGAGVEGAFSATERKQQLNIAAEHEKQNKWLTMASAARAHQAEDERAITAQQQYRESVITNAYRENNRLFTELETARAQEELAARRLAGATARHDLEFEEKFQGRERWIQKGADTVGSVVGGLNPMRGLFRGGGGASAAAAARREPFVGGLRAPTLRPGERLDRDTGEILNVKPKPYKFKRQR